MHSVLGTILDPAADKTLMTTLTVTLAMKGLLPGKQIQQRSMFIRLMPSLVSLASIIIGRDVLLSLSAFYIRYTSLPAPVRVRRIFYSAFTHFSRKPFLDIGTFLYHLLKYGPPQSAR
jgi:cardiolipin synthase